MEYKIIMSKEDYDDLRLKHIHEGSNRGFWKAVQEFRNVLHYKKEAIFGDRVTEEQKKMWDEVESVLITDRKG